MLWSQLWRRRGRWRKDKVLRAHLSELIAFFTAVKSPPTQAAPELPLRSIRREQLQAAA